MAIRRNTMVANLLQRPFYSWQRLLDELQMTKDELFKLLSYQELTPQDQSNLTKLRTFYQTHCSDTKEEPRKKHFSPSLQRNKYSNICKNE